MTVLAFGLHASHASGANDPVTVVLVDGRQVKAQIDPRTDGRLLWLTTLVDRGHLSHSVPWADVVQIDIEGQKFGGWLAQAAVAVIRDHEALEQRPEMPQRPPAFSRAPIPEGFTRPVPVSDLPDRKVHGLTISASLANWDQDVADDGLFVELVPADAVGNPVECDAVADFTLRAWKSSVHGGTVTARSERWSKAVRQGDFRLGSVNFRLPFRQVEAWRSSEWWSRGVLEVRLTVPGSGVVQRTLTDLRLRAVEPMRDLLEQHAGDRYFSSENIRRQASDAL
ncbi:MAG: hypothetical protein ACYC6Y_12315 [Thermoguttaceae bacterium]